MSLFFDRHMDNAWIGDVRPSIDARLIAASEALFGYIWMAAFIGMFAELLRQLASGIRSGLPNEAE